MTVLALLVQEKAAFVTRLVLNPQSQRLSTASTNVEVTSFSFASGLFA